MKIAGEKTKRTEKRENPDSQKGKGARNCEELRVDRKITEAAHMLDWKWAAELSKGQQKQQERQKAEAEAVRKAKAKAKAKRSSSGARKFKRNAKVT